MNVCLYVAKNEIEKDENVSVFKISLWELIELTGSMETNLNRIKDEIKDLQIKFIEYNITSKGKRNWGRFPLIGGVHIEEYERKKGFVEIKYNLPFQIIETIRKPEVYAFIDLLVVKGLKSKHSIVLYEVSRDYYKIDAKTFLTYDLKKLFGVEKKYSMFSMFEKRVLIPAVQEVSEKTEFNVKYEVITRGRKKEKVRFTFNRNDGNIKETTKPEKIDQELFDQLIHYGITPIQINDYLKNQEIGIECIKSGFKYFKKQLEADKIHTNQAAYLNRSIRENWGRKTKDQKGKDDKEESKNILKEKIDRFEQYRFYGLNKEDLEKLVLEISEIYKDTNPVISKSWKERDIDFHMR